MKRRPKNYSVSFVSSEQYLVEHTTKVRSDNENSMEFSITETYTSQHRETFFSGLTLFCWISSADCLLSSWSFLLRILEWRLDHTLQSSHLLADSVRRILLGRVDSYPGLHSSTRESPSLEGSILLDCLSPQPQLYDLLVLSHGLNIRIRIHSLDSRSLQALCTLISTEENISGDAIVPLTEWRRKYLSVLTFSGGASLVWS